MVSFVSFAPELLLLPTPPSSTEKTEVPIALSPQGLTRSVPYFTYSVPPRTVQLEKGLPVNIPLSVLYAHWVEG